MPAIDAANGGMLAGSHFRVNKAIVGYPSGNAGRSCVG
jgi:hypothetical protein